MEAFISEGVQPKVIDLLILAKQKWKLFICTFFIIIFTYFPVHIYTIIMIENTNLTLICPATVLYGVNLISKALILRDENEQNSKTMLNGVLILSLGISLCGILIICLPENTWQAGAIIISYSIFGGYGFSLIYSRMWKLLGKIFNPKNELFIAKFVNSFAQAFSLILCFWGFGKISKDYTYGDTILILGGIVLNLIPFIFLMECEKNYLKVNHDNFMKSTEKGNESFYSDIHKHCNDLQKELEGQIWMNPSTYSVKSFDEEEQEEEGIAELVNRDGKLLNAGGVEILDVIAEEDENELEEDAQPVKKMKNRQRKRANFKLKAAIKLSLKRWNFYSCLLIKSNDFCTLLIFLLILPKYVFAYYEEKQRAIKLAILIITGSWSFFAFALLYCDIKLREQQEKLVSFGLLFKMFGYFCVYCTKSIWWLVIGCVLIGYGYSISCSYQDGVIKRKFGEKEWPRIKESLYLFSGILVILYSIIFNYFYLYSRIDLTLCYLLLFYCINACFWLFSNCRQFCR